MKIVHIVGARPNFMKIAPLLQALEARAGVENILVHTGQHYDHGMSGSFFEDLGIGEPDLNLGVGSGSHAEQTAAVMTAIEPVLRDTEPDLLVVVGDVNSTIAAALTAAKLHIPVAHVEAGLRSRDREMPEEINRILTDQLSELLLTPSPDADENLLAEGIAKERIHLVGNIMIDTLLAQLPKALAEHPVGKFGVEVGSFALVTLHRPSNVDVPEQLVAIVTALEEIATRMKVLLPIHPRTAKRLEESALSFQNVTVIPPVGYREMIALQDGAAVVLTDSGGVQEETTVLGTPCLTLRSTTERPITIEEGTNRLVPIRSVERILEAFDEAVAVADEPRRPKLWDGKTAERIADVFQRWHEARTGD
jgi:UDP-N-acetylglucosamine 2-epimerase (non-hydrolysing)